MYRRDDRCLGLQRESERRRHPGVRRRGPASHRFLVGAEPEDVVHVADERGDAQRPTCELVEEAKVEVTEVLGGEVSDREADLRRRRTDREDSRHHLPQAPVAELRFKASEQALMGDGLEPGVQPAVSLSAENCGVAPLSRSAGVVVVIRAGFEDRVQLRANGVVNDAVAEGRVKPPFPMGYARPMVDVSCTPLPSNPLPPAGEWSTTEARRHGDRGGQPCH